MPLFAFANAGVDVRAVSLGDRASLGIFVGVLAGLVLGKPLGILAASYATVRLGLCVLPRGVWWRGVLVVGTVAGIGFTMAIFIAGLAFPDAAKVSAAKLGVLAASASAGVLGFVLGKTVLPAAPPVEAAATVEEAERSAEL
jgi:NhaA family Na+:H+ antiporter